MELLLALGRGSRFPDARDHVRAVTRLWILHSAAGERSPIPQINEQHSKVCSANIYCEPGHWPFLWRDDTDDLAEAYDRRDSASGGSESARENSEDIHVDSGTRPWPFFIECGEEPLVIGSGILETRCRNLHRIDSGGRIRANPDIFALDLGAHWYGTRTGGNLDAAIAPRERLTRSPPAVCKFFGQKKLKVLLRRRLNRSFRHSYPT
jgi:hypothetical protein